MASKTICTDPDQMQFAYEVEEKVWKMREPLAKYKDEIKKAYDSGSFAGTVFNRYWFDDQYWVEEEVNLNDYQHEELWDKYVSGFYTREEFDSFMENKEYQLIAECVFEYNYNDN